MHYLGLGEDFLIQGDFLIGIALMCPGVLESAFKTNRTPRSPNMQYDPPDLLRYTGALVWHKTGTLYLEAGTRQYTPV